MTSLPGFRITWFLSDDALAQAAGRTSDGRPLYWRAEGGYWMVALGELGWPTDISDWPERVRTRWTAGGTYPVSKKYADIPIGVALAGLSLTLGDIDPRSLTGALATGVTLDPDHLSDPNS